MKCDITGNCFKWHTPTHTSTAISISIIPCTAHPQNNTTAHTEAHSTVCESLRHRASIQRRWKSCTIWHWRNRKWAHIYVLLRWINTHTHTHIMQNPKSEAQTECLRLKCNEHGCTSWQWKLRSWVLEYHTAHNKGRHQIQRITIQKWWQRSEFVWLFFFVCISFLCLWTTD